MDDVLRALDDGKKELHLCFDDYLGFDISAKALTLKVLNLCLMKYQFRNRDSRLLCKPFGLLVDPCNGCNLACRLCSLGAGPVVEPVSVEERDAPVRPDGCILSALRPPRDSNSLL